MNREPYSLEVIILFEKAKVRIPFKSGLDLDSSCPSCFAWLKSMGKKIKLCIMTLKDAVGRFLSRALLPLGTFPYDEFHGKYREGIFDFFVSYHLNEALGSGLSHIIHGL